MDVQEPPIGGRQQHLSTAPQGRAGLSRERVGEALGQWQKAELRLARSFSECRGLGHAQLEDIYQDTALVLLARSFYSEEHLRNALRWGIKRRALHLHRDDRRRGEILAQRGSEITLAAERREEDNTPELAALLVQDRLVVSEFLSELTELERRVFWLVSEGMRYRAIAPVLEIPLNAARKASRECNRKRERFQLLHDTGRLCGYRAHTIESLLAGEGASDALARGAFAHLERCAHCRAEHKTNARRLRRSFQEQAAALLPIPALGHMGLTAQVDLRTRGLFQRLLAFGPPPASGGVRESAVAMLAGGGVAVKLAAGAATVAVLAGGTIGATHELKHHVRPHRSSTSRATTPVRVAAAIPLQRASSGSASAHGEQGSDTRAPAAGKGHSHHSAEAGGFGFLGVSSEEPSARSSKAHAASAAPSPEPGAHTSATADASSGESGGSRDAQSGGGPFSP